MRGAIPPLPHYVFMAWYLVKHRNFIFTLLLLLFHVVTVSVYPSICPAGLETKQSSLSIERAFHRHQALHAFLDYFTVLIKSTPHTRARTHAHERIYEGRLKSSWTRLIIPSRNFVDVR
jgi:hypothetical protein